MMFDTSKARTAILQRIRARQGRPTTSAVNEQTEIDRYLAQQSTGPRPQLRGDLQHHFRSMAERMSSTVDTVATTADAPLAAARYLRAQQLSMHAVIWPALSHLDWAGAGIIAEARAPKRDESTGADLVGITSCFCALAETGTLMLLSGPQTIASTHLLPETHIAIVPASRIVSDMEGAFALLRAESVSTDAMMPRALNMVSGPSRTGDIEQTIVLGAHGPYRVHIIVALSE